MFWGYVSSLCLEDLSQDLGPQQREERRLLPAHQQRDGGNLLGSPVYNQLCVWWIEISLSNQSNLWYFSVYINKTVQKITILSFNIYIWFYLNLHRILKTGITLPYWSLFHSIWVLLSHPFVILEKCEFNGCIIFKKIWDLSEHFMQKLTQ